MCEAAPSNDSGSSSNDTPTTTPKPKPKPKPKAIPKPKAKPKKKATVGYKAGQVDPRLAKAAGEAKKKSSPSPSYATMSVGEKGRGGSTKKKSSSSAPTNQTQADIAMGRTKPQQAAKTASIGYGAGQVDPRLAKAAGLKDSGKVPVTSTDGSLVRARDGSIVTSPRPRARPTTTSGGDSSSSSSSKSSPAPAPAPKPAAAPAGGPATTPLSLNESYSDKKPSTARRRRRGGKRQFTTRRQGTGIGGVGGGVGLNIPK